MEAVPNSRLPPKPPCQYLRRVRGIFSWLVVTGTVFNFPYIGNVIIPIDFQIFQRGRYPTNQICLNSSMSLSFSQPSRSWHILATSSTCTLFSPAPVFQFWSLGYPSVIKHGVLEALFIAGFPSLKPPFSSGIS